MIKLSLDDLQRFVCNMENRVNHDNMKPYVSVRIGTYPNGRKYLELEQACEYPECNSSYYRFDEE